MQRFATKKNIILDLSNKKGAVMIGRNHKPNETIRGTRTEWMTTKEAANYLRISPNALRILVFKKQVKSYRLGRSLRFNINNIDLLIKPNNS